MSFTIFQNGKTPFQAIKTKSAKSQKIVIFPKGLTHAFGPKMALFQTFIFYAIQARKMCFTIFWNKKKAFLGHKNKNFKKPKNRHFLKGVNPWFLVKNGPFSNFFFWAIQARKMSFTILFIQKTPVQPIKKSSKSGKTDIFPKGLTNSFGPKLAIFLNFFLSHYRPGKRSFTIFQNKKTPFQAIKTKSSINRKIDIFPKGLTHGYGPKMALFPTFFFKQYRPGKCLLGYSRTKKHFLKL